jgi:hypothetical protein
VGDLSGDPKYMEKVKVQHPAPINFIKVYNEFYDATEQKINPLPDLEEFNQKIK